MGSRPYLCDQTQQTLHTARLGEAATADHVPRSGLTSLPEENRMAGVSILRLLPQVSCVLGGFTLSLSGIKFSRALSPTASSLNLWVLLGST